MAYTLTFTDGFDCRINGTSVSSPYTLKDDDYIRVYSSFAKFTVNGTVYNYAVTNEITIINEDIIIDKSGFVPSTSETGIYTRIRFGIKETLKVLSTGEKPLKTTSGKLLVN